MKPKTLLVITLLFFITLNTAYYWEGSFGLYFFPFVLFLGVIYLWMVFLFFQQLYWLIKERFTDKKRLLVTSILTAVLLLTFYRPFGLINFARFESEGMLVAEREGAANCMTTFKLKDDFTFKEKTACFGISETSGRYHLQHDTIYFDNVSVGRHEDKYYEFAVIKPSKFYPDSKHFDLVRYESLADTVGVTLWVTKNELGKLKNK